MSECHVECTQTLGALPRWGQRQTRVFAFQSLHSSQFIGAHHLLALMCQNGRLPVHCGYVFHFGLKVLIFTTSQPIAHQVRFEAPLFSSLAAWRGEILSIMPRLIISSAISRLLHWLIGRADWLGASQAKVITWHFCSSVIRLGAPGRGASVRRSSVFRSSALTAAQPSPASDCGADALYRCPLPRDDQPGRC